MHSSLSPCGRGCLREAKTGEGALAAGGRPVIRRGLRIADAKHRRSKRTAAIGRLMATFSHKGRRKEEPLLPVPPARPEPLVHMRRRRRDHVYRFLVFRNRDPDLAGMQM